MKQFDKEEIPAEKQTNSSWVVDIESLIGKEFDLSARNPNQAEDEVLPHPSKLTSRILENQKKLQGIIERIHVMVSEQDRK